MKAVVSWNDPDESLPDDETTVLLALVDGDVWMGFRDGDDWRDVSAELIDQEVEWWAELPLHPVALGNAQNLAIVACERVMDAIVGHTMWNPSRVVDSPDWNEDAHIEVTLTVGDCRALKRALMEAGRLEEGDDHE